MKSYFSFIILFVVSFYGVAQNGNIKGVVVDNDGLQVPFSNIVIESLNKGTYSDVDGNFLLLDVPEGKQTLTVKYLGYEDAKAEVLVEAGKTATVKVSIASKALELDGVVINGFNSGQARALNTQKNKTNITNIVSTDQIGKFPDANIGDAVKRIPGITMQVDQGEARNIIIRGLAPQLNSVTLNGSRIPSAEGDNRNVQMDLIPSDMIQTIEVNKAVTPDMDADALGGSVNLITRTSPQGFRFSATGGSGVNFITDKRILNGSFLLGDRSKNDKFGWMVSASINDNDFGSDNVEGEWGNDAESPLTGEDIEVNPYLIESDIRTYLVQRVRRSFSANFDYKLGDNSTIYLKSIYNWRDDRENRYRLRFRKMEPIFETGTENIIGYEGEARRQTKGGINNNRNQNTRLEDQRMQNYSLGGEHLLGSLELDWMTSFSKASEERLNERYIEYETEDSFEINQDLSNPRYFVISGVNGEENNLSFFELNEISEENQYTEEEDFNVFVNAKLPASLVKNQVGFLKFGAKARLKNKNRDNDFTEYSDLTGNLDAFENIQTRDYTDSDYLAGKQYKAGVYADPKFLGNLNLYNSDLFEGEDLPEEYATANFDVNENVYAGYAMLNQNLTDKLSVVAGVRLEHTSIESTGNALTFDVEGDFVGVAKVKDENSYTNVLPGVHFKYNVTDNTILRLAWTNTLARPNYVDLVPYREINNEDEEIYLGNSDLAPTTSMNFDLMAEHYFKSVGIVSGGLFHKRISDFIYTFQSKDATGYDVYQPLNGDNASVFGVEASFQRRLDFLPGFAKNFSIYLNYTYLTSSADGIRNEDGDVRSDLDLPNTAPNMFNGSIGYTAKKFSVRLSANYSDAYIDEIGGNPFTDRYYDEQFFLDFNANVFINKNLSLYLGVNNITDQPLRYFQGVKARTMQKEFYGQRLTFGLKYDVFKN